MTLNSRAPLRVIPLVDMLFRKVAVDLTGPILSGNEKGHQYILTLVNQATRCPEVVPLTSVETATVVEALMDINSYSRLEVAKEILRHLGTQFVSNCLEEVSRLLPIKRLTTTLYHPLRKQYTERFNGTVKKMLRCPSRKQSRLRHQFNDPCCMYSNLTVLLVLMFPTVPHTVWHSR